MTRNVSLSSAIAHRVGMLILVLSLLVAGWAIVSVPGSNPAVATAFGARSLTPAQPEAAPRADSSPPALIAQDDADDEAEEQDAADEDSEEDESETEEVKVKLKYVGAESDFEVEVVTALPLEKGDEVSNGDVAIEVSTRPIFVFEGKSPAVRSLEIGTVGIDVLQLEKALSALGYSVGTIDETFDSATGAAVAAFYDDHGYELPAPSKGDLEDLADAQDKLAEAYIDRERLLLELADENRPDLVGANEDLVDLQKAEADLKQSEIKLNELREEQAALGVVLGRFTAMISLIQAGIASGDIDADDTDSVSDQLADDVDALIGDKPKDFDTFDELFEAIAEEQAKVFADLDDAAADIALEEVDRDLAQAEVDLAWDKVLEVPSTAKVDDLRLQLKAIDIEIASRIAEVGSLGASANARLSIDEFVFVPNLPGEIDEIDVDVLDEADGTLLEIVTG